jgi:hypothetical protein
MYPEYIRTLFQAANERGIERMVVSHPDFVIGAEPELCRELVGLGAYIEHEIGRASDSASRSVACPNRPYGPYATVATSSCSATTQRCSPRPHADW